MRYRGWRRSGTCFQGGVGGGRGLVEGQGAADEQWHDLAFEPLLQRTSASSVGQAGDTVADLGQVMVVRYRASITCPSSQATTSAFGLGRSGSNRTFVSRMITQGPGAGDIVVVDWFLSALLVLVWVPLCWAPRRVRLRFLPTAGAVSILCFPVGLVAAQEQMHGSSCGSRDNGCFSTQAMHWWFNGLHGLVTCAVLAVATVVLIAARREGQGHP